MFKKNLFTALVLISVFTVQAQVAHMKFGCFYGEKGNPNLACMKMRQFSFNTPTEATDAIKRLLKPIGLAPNFIMVPCDGIQNCAALMLDDGFRYIVYDNAFMSAIASKAQTNWVFMSILGHEVGHHLQGHTTTGNTSLAQRRADELEADKFSGFILSKLGASLVQAQAAMQVLPDPANEQASDHPLRWRRLEAIKRGYEEGSGVSVPNTPVIPAERPSNRSGNVVMYKHDIIRSSGFPDLTNSWSKGFELRQSIYSNNQWYVFMTKDAELGLQSYRINAKFPYEQIKPLWDQKKSITNVNFYAGSWYLVMSQVSTRPLQQWFKRAYFPDADITQSYKDGYYVTDIGYGNGEWVVVCNNKASIAYETQIWRITDSFPRKEIEDNWNLGYRVNVLKYLNNQWVLVMTKFTGSNNVVQRWNTSNSFPLDILMRNENEGFLLKCAAFDGVTWAIVMNK